MMWGCFYYHDVDFPVSFIISCRTVSKFKCMIYKQKYCVECLWRLFKCLELSNSVLFMFSFVVDSMQWWRSFLCLFEAMMQSCWRLTYSLRSGGMKSNPALQWIHGPLLQVPCINYMISTREKNISCLIH